MVLLPRGTNSSVQLSFLDAGLVVSLSAADRRNFEELFEAVVRNQGERVGRLLVERSQNGGRDAIRREVFTAEIAALVEAVHSKGLSLREVGLGSLLTRVLQLCYIHQVKLEARYTAVLVALGVMEGMGRQLDPDVDILRMAAPYVLRAAAARSLARS